MGSFGRQSVNCIGSTRVVLTGVIALVVYSSTVGLLSAQPNTLRQAADGSTYQDHRYRQDAHVGSLNVNQPTSYSTYPQRDVATTPVPSYTPSNSSVQLTDFQAPDPISSGRTDVARQRTLVDTGKALPWQDPNRILDLIMNISLNLVFVLSFAFGAILVGQEMDEANYRFEIE